MSSSQTICVHSLLAFPNSPGEKSLLENTPSVKVKFEIGDKLLSSTLFFFNAVWGYSIFFMASPLCCVRILHTIHVYKLIIILLKMEILIIFFSILPRNTPPKSPLYFRNDWIRIWTILSLDKGFVCHDHGVYFQYFKITHFTFRINENLALFEMFCGTQQWDYILGRLRELLRRLRNISIDRIKFRFAGERFVFVGEQT